MDVATSNFADALVSSKAGICDGVPSTEVYCTFDNILRNVELRKHHIYTTLGVLILCSLCVICSSNRFHSFIFELCIMIVHTFKMCTGDAGPEQSLVLF